MRGRLEALAQHDGHECRMAVLVAALIWLVGYGPFLLVHCRSSLLAASIGVWLFYVQHQFEHTHWAREATGTCTRPRCTAAPTTICRLSCAGSRPISASTTSIICRVAFPTIGSAVSAQPSRARRRRPAHAAFRVCGPCGWPSGMRSGCGSSPLERCGLRFTPELSAIADDRSLWLAPAVTSALYCLCAEIVINRVQCAPSLYILP